MKVKYTIEKRESDSKKKQVMEKVIKALGTKVSVSGECIEVDRNDERKVVDILTQSGLRYQKAS